LYVHVAEPGAHWFEKVPNGAGRFGLFVFSDEVEEEVSGRLRCSVLPCHLFWYESGVFDDSAHHAQVRWCRLGLVMLLFRQLVRGFAAVVAGLRVREPLRCSA